MSDPSVSLPSSVEYNSTTGIWVLSYLGADDIQETDVEPLTLPAGDFTVVCQVLTLPNHPDAAVGLALFVDDTTEPSLITARQGTGPLPVWLMAEYVGTWADFYMSPDGQTWTWVDGGTMARPTEAALILLYQDPRTPVSAQVAHLTVLEGTLPKQPVAPTTVAVRVAAASVVLAPTVVVTEEPVIHVVIGAQFGDLDFDVGKSVRWLMYFADRNFILDVNMGDTARYYVVNWAKTFPEALHSITGINFFRQPQEFRKESFRKADIAWNYNDEDWILFCDASEGFSVDNRTLPDDWAMAPFASYIYREVARAVAAGREWACLPFFVFTEHDDIQNVAYPIGDVPVPDPDPSQPAQFFNADQPIAVPYYIPQQGLRRLVKVSALRNPAFDWSKLDQPSAPDTGVKVQILSYAYAHWNLQDIVPPATTVEPLSFDNDDGFRMRKLISMVRPVAGLPFDDAHWNPTNDAQGLAGPSADMVTYNPIDIVAARTQVSPDPACAGITAPLYDQVFRINLRDGVWYEGPDADAVTGNAGGLGNIPLAWDEATQKWVPGSQYSPQDWQDEKWETVPQ